MTTIATTEYVVAADVAPIVVDVVADVAKRLQRIGVPMTQQEYNTLASQIARTSLPETGLLPASGGQLHRQLIVQLGQVFREVELLRHQMSCQNRTVT
jgi:hypothetical protein